MYLLLVRNVCDKVCDELFPTFAHFQNNWCQRKMRAALTHPASAFRKKSRVGYICMVCSRS